MRLKIPPGQWPEDPALLSKPAPIKGFHGFGYFGFPCYFFFSAFQIVLEMARPQNGQKLMG